MGADGKVVEEIMIINQSTIEQKLMTAFTPTFLKVIDESHKHAGHGGFEGKSGTHFRLIIASPKFERLTALQRHRLIYDVLKEEMDNGLHALTIEVRR